MIAQLFTMIARIGTPDGEQTTPWEAPLDVGALVVIASVSYAIGVGEIPEVGGVTPRGVSAYVAIVAMATPCSLIYRSICYFAG